HVEVVRSELHRHLRALTDDGVAHGPRQIEQERIAELVGLELVRRIATAAARLRPMPTERVLLERREDLLEGFLADLADASRRELVALAVLANESRFLEELGHATELVQR